MDAEFCAQLLFECVVKFFYYVKYSLPQADPQPHSMPHDSDASSGSDHEMVCSSVAQFFYSLAYM